MEKEYAVNKTFDVPYKSVQKNADKITEKRYRSENADITEVYMDKYGRPLTQKTGDDAVAYRYQDEGNPYAEGDVRSNVWKEHTESPSCAKITQIYDPYEQQTYTYHYDDQNRPCGYTSTGSVQSGAKAVKISQIESDKTEYYLGGDAEPRVSKITTDGTAGGTGPRITETEETDGISGYHQRYTYDSIGRLKTVNTDVGGLCNLETKNYKPGTSLLSSIEHKILNANSVALLTVTQNYGYDDNNGNIVSVTESSIPNAPNKSIIFGYDAINRLISENNSELGSYTYNYDTSTGNLIDVMRYGTLVKNFGYVNGKRTSVNGSSIRYDRQGNVIGYLNKTFGYDNRGNVAGINENSYSYNSQGVRYKKTVGGVTSNYYLDGDKILGEDREDGIMLRYFYGAEGIAGVRYNGKHYTFARDGLGNVSKIFSAGALICEYVYDAWGNHKVYSASKVLIYDSSTGDTAAGYETHIGAVNPIRWKSHYYDMESGMYYIDGRYYDPYIMQCIDAEPAENMLANAYTPNGLDRNRIITYNIVAFMCCMHAIFTAEELYPDPLYDPPLMNWWEKHWRELVMLAATVALIAASIVISCIFPPAGAAGAALFGATKTIGSIIVGMVMAGAKAALSGLLISGVLGGLSAALYGGDVWDSIANGAIQGAISGFVLGVAIYAVCSIVSSVVRAVKAANAVRKQMYSEYAQQATHNPGSKIVVLGKYDNGVATSYVNVATVNNGTYFSMSNWDEVAQVVGRKNMWKINKIFLQQQVALGKTFYSSHNIATATGYFKREIKFLIHIGIKISPI